MIQIDFQTLPGRLLFANYYTTADAYATHYVRSSYNDYFIFDYGPTTSKEVKTQTVGLTIGFSGSNPSVTSYLAGLIQLKMLK